MSTQYRNNTICRSTNRINNTRANRRNQNKRRVLLAAIILCVTLMAGCILAYAKSPEAPSTNRNKYFTSYEIQSGDTLHSIAVQFMTEEYKSEKEFFNEIRSINNFRGDILYAGAYLVIPYYAD